MSAMIESRKASSPGRSSLLRDPEALVPASQVDEGLDHGREGLAEERVEGRPEEWIGCAAPARRELDGRVVELLEEHRAASSGDEPSSPVRVSLYADAGSSPTGGLERAEVRGPHR